MLSLSPGGRIYIYVPASDMRKGMNGLSGIIREELAGDPTDGSLFVFINRRRDRMKILHFDGAGYWLHYRLLEAGTFEELKHRSGSRSLTIDATELSMLLSGVSLVGSRSRRKRYAKAEPTEAT